MKKKLAMLLFGAIFIGGIFMMKRYPVINDITTSRTHPPQFVQVLKDPKLSDRNWIYPDSFWEKQQKSYPEVKPLEVSGKQNEIFKVLEQLARNQDWEITRVDFEHFAIEGIAVTPLLRFKDDWVIELRPMGESRFEIHMRSKSRLGKSDLGANAKRILHYFQEVKNNI
ncbi:MAG: hypothetical protein CL678_07845 [Bdellovibrionaceae bacterium]|nr:hypothetical protein [Pseudobdellovibrionaceae bacterium]|tara:strand:- start:1699 stop:2205 length:507 start_codon:yes stop_codon:yes gene_type:complete